MAAQRQATKRVQGGTRGRLYYSYKASTGNSITLLMELTYFKQIQANPHFTLKNFSLLIKLGVAEQKEYIARDILLGDILYSVSFNPKKMELSIEWIDEDDESYKREIQIVAKRSNLPSLSSSVVYYFICPQTGQKSRILYKVGSYFWSRRALKAVYPLQQMSRRNRLLAYREEPYRRHGKRNYRGKATPYGKRCTRYESVEDAKARELDRLLREKANFVY